MYKVVVPYKAASGKIYRFEVCKDTMEDFIDSLDILAESKVAFTYNDAALATAKIYRRFACKWQKLASLRNYVAEEHLVEVTSEQLFGLIMGDAGDDESTAEEMLDWMFDRRKDFENFCLAHFSEWTKNEEDNS